MVLGALAAAVVAALLATALRPRLGTASAVSVAGLLWSLVAIALVTLVPTRPDVGIVPGRAPQRGVLVGLRRPVGRGVRGPRVRPADPQRAALRAGRVFLVLAVGRWRAGLVLAPVGLVALAAYSLAIELTQLQLARIDRACDVTDMVDNVAGAGIGFAIGLSCSRSLRPWRGRRRPSARRSVESGLTPCQRPRSRAQRARQIPAYVAGKPPAARAGLTTYKLSSNENPYPPLPGVLEAAREAAAADEPLPRHGQRRALRRPGRHAGRAGGGPRRRDRVGRADLPARQRLLRARRRGRLRLALLRGLPDRGHRRRGAQRAGAGARRRPPRPRRDGRGGHRPHQGRHRLHAQQPDRPGRHAVRARRVPREGALARGGRGRRGLPRVRADGRRHRRHRHLPRATATSC